MAARNAIKMYSGRYYRVGSISSITKRTIAGSVVDYAYGVVKIPLALVMELPSNEYGFQPPTNKISPLSAESWCGIREMCKQAYSLKGQTERLSIEEERNKSCENTQDIQTSPPQTAIDSEDPNICMNFVDQRLEYSQSAEQFAKTEITIRPQYNVRKESVDRNSIRVSINH